MLKYTCLNPIAPVGLELFEEGYEKVDSIQEADAVLVRSASMHDLELPENLEAVARAGAGVNNIPWKKVCGEGNRSVQYTGSQCKWCQRACTCRYAAGIP